MSDQMLTTLASKECAVNGAGTQNDEMAPKTRKSPRGARTTMGTVFVPRHSCR
jgi:hypothetical protein